MDGFDQSTSVIVVAATNRDLEQMIRDGGFREDLFQRLNGFPLEIPPLRQRRDDIPLLTRFFLGAWNRRYGEEKTFDTEMMQMLADYRWPGNVRELEQAVGYACAWSQGPDVSVQALLPRILDSLENSAVLPGADFSIPAAGIKLPGVLFAVEKRYFEEALEKTNGNKERAARLLGLKGPAFRKACRERFGL